MPHCPGRATLSHKRPNPGALLRGSRPHQGPRCRRRARGSLGPAAGGIRPLFPKARGEVCSRSCSTERPVDASARRLRGSSGVRVCWHCLGVRQSGRVPCSARGKTGKKSMQRKFLGTRWRKPRAQQSGYTNGNGGTDRTRPGCPRLEAVPGRAAAGHGSPGARGSHTEPGSGHRSPSAAIWEPLPFPEQLQGWGPAPPRALRDAGGSTQLLGSSPGPAPGSGMWMGVEGAGRAPSLLQPPIKKGALCRSAGSPGAAPWHRARQWARRWAGSASLGRRTTSLTTVGAPRPLLDTPVHLGDRGTEPAPSLPFSTELPSSRPEPPPPLSADPHPAPPCGEPPSPPFRVQGVGAEPAVPPSTAPWGFSLREPAPHTEVLPGAGPTWVRGHRCAASGPREDPTLLPRGGRASSCRDPRRQGAVSQVLGKAVGAATQGTPSSPALTPSTC